MPSSHLKTFALLVLVNLPFMALAQEEPAECIGLSRIYVSPSGSDSTGNGTTMAPFASIQLAVDTACVGDTVLLLPGAYEENISISNKILTIAGATILNSAEPEENLVQWIGNGAISVIATDSEIHFSHIDFVSTSRALSLSNCANSSMTFCRSFDSNHGNNRTFHFGSCDSLHISNCWFEGGTGYEGHTISIGYSVGFSVDKCTFLNNDKCLKVEFSQPIDNSGIQNTISNCLFKGNNSQQGGAVVVGFAGNATITNSTFIGNRRGIVIKSGGALERKATAYVVNSIIVESLTEDLQMGNWNTTPVELFISNSIVSDINDDYSWYSDYTELFTDSTVIDSEAYLTEDGYLQPVSPAIGTGTTQVEWPDGTITNIMPTDLDGNPRPMPEGSLPDMGCYEHELGEPLPVEGCTDEAACNYDPFAVVDDGGCNLPACLNPEACNFDAEATCDGGPEACVMPSCTDAEACNFDAEAACGGGECYYGEAGCDDPAACNYVADAGCVDLTLCDYSCCPGPGCCGAGTVWSASEGKCQISPNCRYDFDLSGEVNLADLLDFLAHYETVCTP